MKAGRTRALYSEASIFYDAPVESGDYILTANKRTAYFVTRVRVSPTNPRRRYLRVLRWPPDDIPAGSTVRPLHWYARGKR